MHHTNPTIFQYVKPPHTDNNFQALHVQYINYLNQPRKHLAQIFPQVSVFCFHASMFSKPAQKTLLPLLSDGSFLGSWWLLLLYVFFFYENESGLGLQNKLRIKPAKRRSKKRK